MTEALTLSQDEAAGLLFLGIAIGMVLVLLVIDLLDGIQAPWDDN